MNPEIIVPALALRTAGGRLDETATKRYAQRAALTWVDRFLLSGTTTQGSTLSEAERVAVLDLWRELVPSARLVAGCWSDADVANALQRGVAPLVVMRALPDRAAAERFLRLLPDRAHVYSHPAHSPMVLDAQLCAMARRVGHLPAGAKVAKVRPNDLRAIRAETGSDFALWDASSRDIASSVTAGASGVVATPLSPFVEPLPRRELGALQAALDRAQSELDKLPSRRARSEYLHGLAAAA